MTERPLSLVLVGAGKMGSALLGGWFAQGIDGATITIIDPAPSEETQMAARAREENEALERRIAALEARLAAPAAAAVDIGFGRS